MKIAAVIVTFNRKELLLKTIESLKQQSRKLDTIYIIDNASTDGTQEYLINNNIIYGNNNENIVYNRMEYNSGGAGGFYEGIKIAHQDNHDWIWVMDDDVCPDVNALINYENIILNSKEEIGALMGLRYYEDKPFSFESTKHDFSNFKNLDFKQDYVDVDKIDKEELVRIYDMPFEGPIINSKIIDKIGYPNYEFFIIGDDTDYAIRINKHAPIYLTSKVRINRMITPYSEYVFGWKEYYSMRNITYLNKVYGLNNNVKYIRPFIVYIKNIYYAIKKAIINKDTRHIKKWLKITEAYIYGIRGTLGKKYTPGDF